MTSTVKLSATPRCRTDKWVKTQFDDTEHLFMQLRQSECNFTSQQNIKLKLSKVQQSSEKPTQSQRVQFKEVPLLEEFIARLPMSKSLTEAFKSSSLCDVKLGIKRIAYYGTLLTDKDSTNNIKSGKTIIQLPAINKMAVETRKRNIVRNKALLGSPVHVITLFLTIQSAFASAVPIQFTSSSELDNHSLSFDNQQLKMFKVNEGSTLQYNEASIKFLSSENSIQITDMLEGDIMISTEQPNCSVFTSAFEQKIERVKNYVDELILELTNYNNTQRFKRAAAASNNVTGTFTRPNSNNINTRIENELRKMKEDIQKLKASSQISVEDRKLLLVLQATVERLARILDDQSTAFELKYENQDRRIKNLIAQLNEFENQLDSIREKAEEQERIMKQNRLPTECSEAVKRQDFTTAKKKLEEIDDYTKIDLIIKEVFNYQTAGFDLVLTFGNSFTGGAQNRRHAFLIYKALSHEMKSNAHLQSANIAKLIESLETRVINQPDTSNDIKTQAYSLMGRLVGWLPENSMKRQLSKVVKNLEATKSYVETVEERGIDIKAFKDSYDDSLFHNAILADNLDVVKYLINEKGENANIQDRYNLIPLNFAAMNGKLNTVKYLINEKNVDVNIKDPFGDTPLHFAAANGQLDVAKYLITEKNADVTRQNKRDLYDFATRTDSLDAVRYLFPEIYITGNSKPFIRVP